MTLGFAIVAHIYNPRYLGGGEWEDLSSRLVWAKMLAEIPTRKNKVRIVVCGYNPSYAGGRGKRTEVCGWAKQKVSDSIRK
jgi:hypothetical protein